MKRVFFCGVLPSKYSGRWRGCPQFDFAKEKRNSPKPLVPVHSFMRRRAFRFSFAQTERERKQAGKNFYPVGSRSDSFGAFPQPPSFLPACLGFAPKTFGRTDFLTTIKSLFSNLPRLALTSKAHAKLLDGNFSFFPFYHKYSHDVL